MRQTGLLGRLRQRWIAWGMQVLIVGLLLPAMGCAPRYVQLAQESFSKGADIENRAALVAPDNLNNNVSATASSALIDYMDARDNIRRALGKQRSQLDSDGLAGSALALQALISWRLDDLVGSTSSGGDVCSGQNYRLSEPAHGSHDRSDPAPAARRGGCGDALRAVAAGWAGRRRAGQLERQSARGGRRTLTMVVKQCSSAEDAEGPPFELLSLHA
jgi:hypothetical protein